MHAVTVNLGTPNKNRKVVIISVHRAPWVTNDYTKMMSEQLGHLLSRYGDIFIMGDFNFPYTDRSIAHHQRQDSCIENLLRHYCDKHNLTQIATQSTSHTNVLDLIFISSIYKEYDVIVFPPAANSDHNSQLLILPAITTSLKKCTRNAIQFENVVSILKQINWQ